MSSSALKTLDDIFKLPLWAIKVYFNSILSLTGAKKELIDFPKFLLFNKTKFTLLYILSLPLNLGVSLAIYFIRFMKLTLAPELIFQRIILLFLFQSLYEFGGFFWRTLRWGIWSKISRTGRLAKDLQERMKTSESYQEWRKASLTLAKVIFQQEHYLTSKEEQNLKKLEFKIRAYKNLLLSGSEKSLRTHLRQDLLRKSIIQTTSNPLLKQKAKEYQSLQLQALNQLTLFEVDGSDIVDELKIVRERLNFFKETQQSYGNSALLLSGGATLGLIHIGVIKTLLEQKLLPNVFGGSSAGSICCALLATATDEELEHRFLPKNLNLKFFGRIDSLGGDMDKLFLTRATAKEKKKPKKAMPKRMDSAARAVIVALPPPLQDWLYLLRKLLPKYLDSKALLDGEVLAKSLRDVIGDITFIEAYKKTGRVLNISVTPQYLSSDVSSELPQLLNYLTAPDVVVWSAAVASCSIPGVFAPQPLYKKELNGNIITFGSDEAKWADGSLECDLPISRIKEMFDVNHFIVSQVNPHARLIAPHDEINFYGFMPSALADLSDKVWTQLGAFIMFQRDQIRSWTKHVVDFSLKSYFFKSFGKGVLPLITQKYHGDITLTPDIRLADLKGLLQNPNEETFLDARLRGERMTWPKLSTIRRRCSIEFMLSDCISALRDREQVLEERLFQAYRASGAHFKLKETNKMGNLKSQLKNRVVSVIQLNQTSPPPTPRSGFSLGSVPEVDHEDENGHEDEEDFDDVTDTEPPMF